jgi:hypothetical protein
MLDPDEDPDSLIQLNPDPRNYTVISSDKQTSADIGCKDICD